MITTKTGAETAVHQPIGKYDSEIDIFRSVDALWEQYHSVSPYNYCGNNPLMFRDPTGMGWFGNLAKDGKDIAQGVFDAIVSDITGQDIRTGDQSSRLYRASKLGAHAADVYVGTKLTIVGAGAEVAGVVAAPETGGASLSITVAGAGLTAGGVWLTGNAIGNAGQMLSQMSQSSGGGEENKQESPNKTELKPLGRGSMGRTEAKNLDEQMAMQEIMSDPTKGESIIKGINDSRWKGWDKMQYVHRAKDGSNITIHYVGKLENGTLKAVDDFKFK